MPSLRPVTGVVLLTLALGSSLASAQEGGNYLNYGGVQIPIRSDTPVTPDTRGPGSGSPDSFAPGDRRASGNSSAAGDGGGAAAAGEGDTSGTGTGETMASQRLGAVRSSATDDRASWFYPAGDLYLGIIPRIHDSLPHIARFQRAGEDSGRPNRITWVGFQALPGYTRVFVQTARAPRYTINRIEDGRAIEIIFDNTRISLNNFRRFMDASHFGRSVQIIDAEGMAGGRSRVVILLDGERDYTATVDGDYLYVDFQDVTIGRW